MSRAPAWVTELEGPASSGRRLQTAKPLRRRPCAQVLLPRPPVTAVQGQRAMGLTRFGRGTTVSGLSIPLGFPLRGLGIVTTQTGGS